MCVRTTRRWQETTLYEVMRFVCNRYRSTLEICLPGLCCMFVFNLDPIPAIIVFDHTVIVAEHPLPENFR